MSNFNRAILLGRLTRDPEIKYTGGGTAVCNLSLAVNRRVKKGDAWEDEASFFDVVVFGRQAESVAQYLAKGREALIEGELTQRRWEAKDGSKRSKIEVVANNVQFIGGRRDDADNAHGDSRTPGHEETPPPLDDGDIPF